MIEFAQSSLAALIASAVITSALLGFAAHEKSAAAEVQIDAALDAVALQIAGAACGAERPATRIALEAPMSALRGLVERVALTASHLRAVGPGGAARTSIEFPSLDLQHPMDILGASSLDLSFDPASALCVPRVS